MPKTSDTKLQQDALNYYAENIRSSIEQANQHFFEAGKNLQLALELFKSTNKSAKEWLAWADRTCNIKKAQAYNLVKIHTKFGEVSEYKGCAMRVLNILVHTKDEDYQKIEEQAISLAKKGKLDTKAVNTLLSSIVPKKAEPKSSVPKESSTNAEPASKSTNEIKEEKEPESKELQELIKQNKELLAKISELESKLAAKSEETEVAPKVMYLPQFDSNLSYLVLGLAPDSTKEEINKQYRTMAAIFNAKTCPKGAKALKQAKDEMIKTL